MKTYANRDSATSALRKIGIHPRDYNLFIGGEKGKFTVDLDKAQHHKDSLNKKAEKSIDTLLHDIKPALTKALKDSAKATGLEKPERKTTVGAVCRELITKGKTNAEIWAVIEPRFSMPAKRKYFPAWYRFDMKRKGLL